MQNTMNKAAVIILTLLLFIGTSLAQEDNNSDKTEKKCAGGCCSGNAENTKMDHDKMNHSNMMDMKSMDKNNDGQIYQCPMHADQISDEPGKCSECGMNLKEVSVNDIEHNMKKKEHKMMKGEMDHKEMSDHHSIDKNKDGKIFECPMKCEAGKDSPGECSKCGMKLKEVSVKETEHKMMDHNKMDHSMMKHSKMEHKDHQNLEKVDFTEYDKNNDGKVFQCPMNCEVPQDNAGECSKCGMQLKEVSINQETK